MIVVNSVTTGPMKAT